MILYLTEHLNDESPLRVCAGYQDTVVSKVCILCPFSQEESGCGNSCRTNPLKEMKMLNAIVIEEKFFKLMLLLLKAGQHKLVYQVSSLLGGRLGLSRLMQPLCNASWDIQGELVKHGYALCPSCQWVATESDPHDYCNEQLR